MRKEIQVILVVALAIGCSEVGQGLPNYVDDKDDNNYDYYNNENIDNINDHNDDNDDNYDEQNDDDNDNDYDKNYNSDNDNNNFSSTQTFIATSIITTTITMNAYIKKQPSFINFQVTFQ